MERDHSMKSHAARKAAMVAAVLKERKADNLTTVEELTAALESLAYDYGLVTSAVFMEWRDAVKQLEESV